jgi:hypothetical protein
VHKWANAYRALALAHPNLVLRVVADPAAVAVAAVHVNESLYAALDASGLPPRTVVRAADASSLTIERQFPAHPVLPGRGSGGLPESPTAAVDSTTIRPR